MALITTISELQQYILIDDNAKIETLTPFINEAEELFIVELLGQEFYDEFTTAYAASVLESSPIALSDDNKRLLVFIQRCLAYYTQLMAIPQLSVTFGDMGIRQHRSENSDAAARWQQEKLQLNALTNGDRHADKLLEFLEANASDSAFTTWYESTANTKNSGFIVYGTAIASKYIDINNSRRVFLQLRNKIREIETRIIPKLISPEQYADLVVDIKANTISDEYQALLDKLCPIICKRALYMQLEFMRIQVNDKGVLIYSGTDEIVRPNLASAADIKSLRNQLCEPKEFGFPADEHALRDFIIENINDYPLIKASTVYTVPPNPGPTWQTENSPFNKHFGV